MKFVVFLIISFLLGTQSSVAAQILRLNSQRNIITFAEILDNNNVQMSTDEIREMVNIIQLVERIGIPVFFDKNLTNACGFVETSGEKFIIGKPAVSERCGPIIQTFRHEGFHVVQLCASDGDTVSPIGINISNNALRRMNSTITPYPKKVRPLEAEAFESETIPWLTVQGLSYCLGE